MKRLILSLAAVAGVLAMLVVLYLTCITEVEKTWMDTDAGVEYEKTTEPLYLGTYYQTHFIAQRSVLDELWFRPVTWHREYRDGDVLSVELRSDRDGGLIAQCLVPLSALPDNQMTILPISEVRLVKGEWYSLRFEGYAEEEEHSISLLRTDRGDSKWVYSEENGKRMEDGLVVRMKGHGVF